MRRRILHEAERHQAAHTSPKLARPDQAYDWQPDYFWLSFFLVDQLQP